MMKVLIIITTGFVPWGGLTTVAMNYYRAMDKTGLQIDFASSNDAPQSLVNEVEINGGKYFRLPNRKKKILNYMVSLYRYLKRKQYDIIHIHGNSATMTFELLPAWLAGVKRRIVHVHTTRNQHRLMNKVLYPLFNGMLTDRIAVSYVAGNYLYKKKCFTVLHNAIDTEHYRFREKFRERCRKKYEIAPDAYVIGTVGKINASKNQSYLVDTFTNVLERVPDAKLMIVGDGELRGKLETQIETMEIKDFCILTGMQEDTAEFLQAMDVFVFPSGYEGLGLALIEAQAAGLPCVASDAVPSETRVSENIEYLSLEKPAEIWAEQIVKWDTDKRQEKSELACRMIAESGYGIKTEANKLRKIYLEA